MIEDFYDIEDTTPKALGAEAGLIGAILIDGAKLDDVSRIVYPGDFYNQANAAVYSAFVGLSMAGEPIDTITTLQRLKNDGALSGAAEAVSAAARSVSSAASAKTYARLIRDASLLRQLISTGSSLIQSAREPEGQTASDLVSTAEQQIFEIADKGTKSKGKLATLRNLTPELIDQMNERAESGDNITGLRTGFKLLDEMSGGLLAGGLYVVGARPGHGKTTLAVNIAENTIFNGGDALIFSLEMDAKQLGARILASQAGVAQDKIRTGDLTRSEWSRVGQAAEKMAAANLVIDDTPGITPSDIRSTARRVARAGKLDLVVVDYLQLLSLPGGAENRTNEIGIISRNLKMLARELNVPVILISQLNRAIEQRPNKMPVMSDLRDSGSIEADADMVLFLYREELYNPNTDKKGQAECIIGKHRHGPTGEITLTFIGEHSRFENFSPQFQVPEHDEPWLDR